MTSTIDRRMIFMPTPMCSRTIIITWVDLKRGSEKEFQTVFRFLLDFNVQSNTDSIALWLRYLSNALSMSDCHKNVVPWSIHCVEYLTWLGHESLTSTFEVHRSKHHYYWVFDGMVRTYRYLMYLKFYREKVIEDIVKCFQPYMIADCFMPTCGRWLEVNVLGTDHS